MKRTAQLLFPTLLTTLAILLTLAVHPQPCAAQTPAEILAMLKTEVRPRTPLLPANVTIKPDFIGDPATLGQSVGEVQISQGKALVIHPGTNSAYQLKKGNPVFTGDMLITQQKSRLNIIMNDKSAFSLAPHSKLIIDKSFYDPTKNQRSTEMQLMFGRVRSVVTKIGGTPNYKIKTPTAVAGVRGTDFALAVSYVTEKQSSLDRFLAFIQPVSIAHAFVGGALITTVVTGPGSTVGFAGMVGATQTVGALSVSAAVAGTAATSAAVVGAAAAGAALSAVGPSMASMSMPPRFN